MKLWKFSALVSVLLASSAFGAVTWSTTPVGPDIAPNGDGTWTVDVNVNVTGGEKLAGFGLFAVPSLDAGQDVTGKITVNRTNFISIMDPTTSPANLVNKVLTPSGPDLGGTGQDVLNGPFIETNSRVMTLQFIAAPGTTGVVHINFTGSWVDANTLDTGVPGIPDLAINLVPEPVSGLLLALGGLFFARRRRA